MKKYGGFRNRKCIEFFVRFAKVCFERYKDQVKYWMTFNEINNQSDWQSKHHLLQVAGILVNEGENQEELMYQAAHYAMVASAMAVKLGHEINPDFKIGCMISMCPIYPYSCKPEDMMMATAANQRRYYYADVSVKGTYPAYIKKIWERKGYDINVTEEDMAILKAGTVDYIGFSYYMSMTIRG